MTREARKRPILELDTPVLEKAAPTFSYNTAVLVVGQYLDILSRVNVSR